MALALKSLPTPALDLPLCLLSPLPLIVTSTRFAVQFDSVNKAMDKKLDDMSTALISRFSLMLAQFQSRINQPYPISTLPEHLHSTFPSYAKIPENTLTEKKKFLFPL